MELRRIEIGTSARTATASPARVSPPVGPTLVAPTSTSRSVSMTSLMRPSWPGPWTNPRLLDALLRRRSGGERLLAFKDGRRWRDLVADDVNTYVKDVLGEDFSAKDFRTWRGTVIAAHALAKSDASSTTARKRSVAAAMREVGDHLGNTPTVARGSYVDPRVVDLFDDGITVAAGNRSIAPGAPVSRTLEGQVLRLLKRA